MVQGKGVTEPKIEGLWWEVKGDGEDCWGYLKQETLRMVKRLLESAMAEELPACAGAALSTAAVLSERVDREVFLPGVSTRRVGRVLAPVPSGASQPPDSVPSSPQPGR